MYLELGNLGTLTNWVPDLSAGMFPLLRIIEWVAGSALLLVPP